MLDIKILSIEYIIYAALRLVKVTLKAWVRVSKAYEKKNCCDVR